MNAGPEPFQLEGVVHLLQPWGEPAADLEQLLDQLGRTPDEVVFAHTRYGLLRDAGVRGAGMDDLSLWVAAALQDPETAERMWFAAGSAEPRAGPVRDALVTVLASVPEKRRQARRAPEGGEFRFFTATPLTYHAGLPRTAVADVLDVLLGADLSVWFHHVHEERWQTGERPVLIGWLEARGESRLAGWLEDAARSGLPLELSRHRFHLRLRMSRAASRRGVAAVPGSEEERAAVRGAARRLVRRLAGEEPRA